ncbi:hypothetical protein [Mycoplasma putrefaciens]|uniref:Transmembrane protein n=1 Tax=Mycoplasma putrefaciens Mput9231 TaxID=1292033 RepID=M9WGJ4_9MOLU|nr:hypothetical protein [Mycoplasma putrefaciens]AGJ90504.1 Hypothetical protein, predicted transmembrane protein [Mycoplasma putrefaciens Mput9231]
MKNNRSKSKFKLKLFDNKFSVKITDANKQVQKKNVSIYTRSILGIIVFLMTMMPFYAYLHIIFNDPGLNFYFENYQTISKYVNLPSKSIIWGFAIAGLVMMFLVVLMFVLFKAIVSLSNNRKYKQTVTAIIVSLSVIAVIFQTISQYYYGFIEDFLDYQIATAGFANKLPEMNQINQQLNELYKNHTIFRWISDEKIWWISFAQFFLIFTVSILLQNAIFTDDLEDSEDKYITYINQKTPLFTGSKIKLLINKIFSYKARILTNWVLVTVSGISLVVIVYVIGISLSGPIQSLFKWSFQLSNLLNDFEGYSTIFEKYKDNLNLTRVDPLLVISFPILVLGITLSTSLFLVSISLRGQKFYTISFKTQYIVLFIQSILLIISTLVSQLELQKILTDWNHNNQGANYIDEIEGIITKDNWNKFLEKFPLNKIDQEIESIFTNNYLIFSEFTILITSTLVSFAIIGKGIYIKESIIKEVEQAIEQKNSRFWRGYTHVKKTWRK